MTTPRQIIAAVADDYLVTVSDLVGGSRTRAVLMARQEAMYRLRQAGYTPTTIGQFLRRHRTTVLAGIRRHAER